MLNIEIMSREPAVILEYAKSALSGLAKAAAVATELEDVSVVQQSVEHSGGERGVAVEGLFPAPKRGVRGQDDAPTEGRPRLLSDNGPR